MEMGLGKTAVVLAEFMSYQNLTGLVVVCPNSIKYVWAAEVEKMGAKIPNIYIWPHAKNLEERDKVPFMQVINYEAIITNAGSAFLMRLLQLYPCYLAIDESTQIKNHKARRTKTLLGYAKWARARRVLSGAPVVQGPHDLWSQLRVIGALEGMNYFQFRNRFCKMGGYLGKQVVGAQNEQELHSIITAWGFRAVKKDWLDLPRKIYSQRTLEMTKRQRFHYKQMREDFITTIEQVEIDVQMVISQMQKLQQIGSGFLLDANGRVHYIEGGNPKFDALMELLDEISGKLVIFCFYKASVALLQENLINHVVIDGNATPQERAAAVERFNNDPSIRVAICQIQSARYGLTLLGTKDQPCHNTVFYENMYSLDARLQAEDRNHRIGQTQPVTYVDFIVSDIDKLVVKALARKLDIARTVVDGLLAR
jgi:SNF2 family DNA or RNA helicase